ncbi:bifunctional diguanylate cyclase/phosphohydrolase [Cohnella silvisoli]|uniref:Diguanylate cyclase n=1 Tax=Cohnella silvisoli TaxID=2873699 RepID=A0ABV1L4D7_9BACL|nr:diguanylate cyclase [Cohnella silvisoli]MCD9026567.1 diguanylate cyclase [Cohnella silvisoli]
MQLRQPKYTYAFLVCLAGSILFVTSDGHLFQSYSTSEWVTIYAMVAAVLILEHYTFQLPPEGNQQSMDSSIYLAAVFTFGVSFALFVLLISSFVLMLYDRSMKWWKHPLNFAIYTFMITGASVAYHLLGGNAGAFDIKHMTAYIFGLTAYFFINVLLVGFYYFLLYKGKLFEVIKTFLTDAIFAYLSTLLLSLVLVILIVNNRSFGLFLFLAIAVLLSHAFRRLFVMYSKISDKVNTDQRTGLYSHSYFEEKLDDYIKESREKDIPLSLALLDLDDFKKYNDAFGHPQGDRLLGFFGQIVKAECEANQLLAARYGGEEFSIILPSYTKEKAFQFIDGLRKKINDTPFDGVDVFPHGCISFSAGILEVNTESFDKSQLVGWADRALYVAKSKGKNTVFIYGEVSNLPQRLEHDINEIEQQIKIFLSKDVYTFKHSKRVFSYAVDMAEVLNLNEENRRLLVLGALIHDIGKLEIPRDILNKKTKLTNEEWEIIKKHVLWGKEIVLATNKYQDLAPLVELHHERFDGKGYPHGLKNKEIPRLARLLCIIDSFDAMTTERPYQDTKSFQEALNELRRCSGTQFDPELADSFIQYIESRLTQDKSANPVGTEAI